MKSALFGLLALTFLSTACARDFEVPQWEGVDSLPPTVESFAPGEVHAGEVLSIQGQHFDPTAPGNEIRFQGGSATAYGFDARGHLLVRVPADIQDGPITVATTAGVSAPSTESLIYLGFGATRRGEIVAEEGIFHRPSGLFQLAGEVIAFSSLYNEFVVGPDRWRSGVEERPLMVDAYSEWRPPSISAAGGRLWVSDRDQFFSLDPANGNRREESVTLSPGWQIAQIAAVEVSAPSPGVRVWIFEKDLANPDGDARVGVYDPAAGSYTLQPWPGISPPTAVEVFDETRLLLAGTAEGMVTLDLGTGAPSAGTGLHFLEAMTAWSSVHGRRGAVYLSDGRFLLYDGDLAGPDGRIDPLTVGTAADLLFAAGDGTTPDQLIVSIPSAGRVVSVEADPLETYSSVVRWSARIGVRPSQLSFDPATRRLLVADEASNTLEVLHIDDGRSLGTLEIPIYLGLQIGVQDGLALLSHQDERYLVLPNTPSVSVVGRTEDVVTDAIVLVPLSDPSRAVGYRVDPAIVDPLDPYGIVAVRSQRENELWVMSGWHLHRLEFGTTTITRSDWSVDGNPSGLTFGTAGRIHLADGTGIRSYDPATPGVAVATHPYPYVNTQEAELLATLEDGRILLVTSDGDSPRIQLWESDALASASGQPIDTLTVDELSGTAGNTAAAWLDGDLFLFGDSKTSGGSALRVGLDGTVKETVGTTFRSSSQLLGGAPGGTSFLWTEPSEQRCTLSSLHPGRPISDDQVFRFDDHLGGAAFLPGGETAYLSLARSHRFVVLE